MHKAAPPKKVPAKAIPAALRAGPPPPPPPPPPSPPRPPLVFHLPNTAVTGAFTLDQLPDFAFEVVGDHLPTEIFVLRSVSERFAKCPTIGSAEGLYGNGEFGGRVSYVYGSEPPPPDAAPSLVHGTALEAIALLRRVVDSPGDVDDPYYIWSGVMDGLWDKYGLGEVFGPIADINSDQNKKQACVAAFRAKYKEEQLSSLDEVEAEVRAKGVSVPGILLRALEKHKGGPLDGILWKWWDGSEEFPKMCTKHYIEITANQATYQFGLRPVVRVTRPGGKVRAPPCSAARPPEPLTPPTGSRHRRQLRQVRKGAQHVRPLRVRLQVLRRS